MLPETEFYTINLEKICSTDEFENKKYETAHTPQMDCIVDSAKLATGKKEFRLVEVTTQ